MKLRNKKTGEIRNAVDIDMYTDSVYLKVSDGEFDNETIEYHSLAELNEEWEDYEEPKDTNYWYIDSLGKIEFHSTILDEIVGTPNNAMIRKIIGNYFESREEAEQAVEKLKAWKRLRDKGFRFTLTPAVGSLDVKPDKFQIEISAEMSAKWFCCDAIHKDLYLLFGGEE